MALTPKSQVKLADILKSLERIKNSERLHENLLNDCNLVIDIKSLPIGYEQALANNIKVRANTSIALKVLLAWYKITGFQK